MQSPSTGPVIELYSESDGEDFVKRAADLTWLEAFSVEHRYSVQQVFPNVNVERAHPTLYPGWRSCAVDAVQEPLCTTVPVPP